MTAPVVNTLFVPGTTITHEWLNGVNDYVNDQTASQIPYTPPFTGGVVTTVQDKLSEYVSVKDFGAVGDGVTDDTAAIQAAFDAAAAWSTVAIPAGSSESVGGGVVYFPQTAQGYVVGDTINVPTKIRIYGPAKLLLPATKTGFTFTYTGSTNHSGVIVENLDFIGGSIGINVGDQSAGQPISIYNCKFVNQTAAGVKIGAYGYASVIRDCTFTGQAGYAVQFTGQAADDFLIDHNVFIYNDDHDIHVTDNNVLRITNNEFVSNGKTPAVDATNIYFNTGTSNFTGGFSVISNNKFGPENRTEGSCITFAGSSGVVPSVSIMNNLFAFEPPATIVYAIDMGTKNVDGFTIIGNTLVNCALMSTGAMLAAGYTKDNTIIGNVTNGTQYSDLLKSNFDYDEYIEPPTFNKYNLFKYSSYINSGADFTYTNATPSYLSATDENGVANNATTVIATAANNIIQINSLDTNNQQKFYTFSLWLKLDTAGDVLFNASRSTNFAFYRTIHVGTAWQRVTIPFYQTYYTAGNPYTVQLTIPNGSTVTLGNVCCVPGCDAGDLRRSSTTIEYAGGIIKAAASPVAGVYWAASSVAKNSAPAVGQPKGWVCTVAGNPGTWVSEGNL